MSMAFLYVAGNDGTQAYTLEASCLLGSVAQRPIPDLAGYLLLGGTPLANQLVGIVSPSPGGDKTTTTDQNGYFQFVNVPKGTLHGLRSDFGSGQRSIGRISSFQSRSLSGMARIPGGCHNKAPTSAGALFSDSRRTTPPPLPSSPPSPRAEISPLLLEAWGFGRSRFPTRSRRFWSGVA